MLNAMSRVPIQWKTRLTRRIWRNKELYLIVLLPLIYFVVFRYIPIYGAQIAFKNFSASRGIWESPWVGFVHFERFFGSYTFTRVLANTLGLSLYRLAVGFPAPILLAFSLNYCGTIGFKKTVQMTTYAPHFISVVVVCGIIVQVLGLRTGIVNRVIALVGAGPVDFLGDPRLFKSIYVWSDVWQQMGWGSIIYLAALSAVDPGLHESAIMDGASKLQRIRHIDFPLILPTTVVLLILNVGRIMDIGFEKVLLLQNPLNLRTSEIIQSYVYKVGLTSGIPQFSYAAAIGLFSSITSLVLLVLVNQIAKRVGETSLW